MATPCRWNQSLGEGGGESWCPASVKQANHERTGILERHVRFHSDNNFSWLEIPVQHSLPKHHVILRRLCSAWAVGFGYSIFLEFICAATAHVSKPLLQHGCGVFVVGLNAVGGDHHSVGFPPDEPFRFLLNLVVGLKHRWFDFGIGVVKTKDEFSVVHFSIGVLLITKPLAWPNESGPLGFGAKRRTTLPFVALFKSGSPSRRAFASRFSNKCGASFSNTDRTASNPCSLAMVLAWPTSLATKPVTALPCRLRSSHPHDSPNDRTNSGLSFVFRAFCRATCRMRFSVVSSGVQSISLSPTNGHSFKKCVYL